MSREEANERLRQHAAVRLSELYDALASLIVGSGDSSMDQADVQRLCDYYGPENVTWILGVLADDLHSSKAEAPVKC